MANKNTLIASALTCALGLSSFATQAADQTGQVQFIGVITSVTCKIDVIDEKGNKMDVINLGTVAATEPAGDEVIFKLKADPEDGDGCKTNLTNGTTVEWFGDFNENGLENKNGTAKNWYVSFGPEGESPFTNVTSNEEFYSNGEFATPGDFEVAYVAQMVKSGSDTTPGDVNAIVKYTVQYN